MAQVNSMHNLTTLIKRLEAATSRLEDIASSTIQIPQAVPSLQETLATPRPDPDAIGDLPPNAPPPAVEALPESIEDFDGLLRTSVGSYLALSNAIGGPIAEQAAKVVRGFEEERKFLLVVSRAKKPNLSNSSDKEAYQALLRPVNDSLLAVVDVKESNRGLSCSNELNTVADGIMMLAWVTDEAKPHKQVENALGSAQYYGNRVLKDNKDKDPQQVEWIQSFYRIFKELTEYIKQYYPSGITWNPHGQPLQQFVTTTSPARASPSAPPPPPGPPPVLQINENKGGSTPAAAGGLDAVFSELNKGEAVTAGLRKVDRSQMTHKNPALRAGSTVSDGPGRPKSPAPGKKPKPESMRTKKPPVMALDGNKWTVENFDKEASPVEIEASLSHSVLISRCANTTIIVKGKANAVTVDNTSRVSLIVDTLVSSVDVVKSQNFALQVLGSIPTVMVDSVDGAQVYLSRESTSTRIIHSKSAGINLNVLSGPDDDYVEVPLPAQITSYYDVEKGALVDELVSHAG